MNSHPLLTYEQSVPYPHTTTIIYTITMNSQKNDPIIEYYPDVFSQNNPSGTVLLSEIIKRIKSSPDLEKTIQEIREASTKEQQDSIKKRLPIFRPCASAPCEKPYETNGIIQLDVDVYDVEKSEALKQLLAQKIPSLLYAFISPKGGLKLAVLTDVVGKDKDCYEEAYYLTVTHIENILGRDKTPVFDDACKSLSQCCYFSSDPGAHYSSNSQVLKIADQIREIIKTKAREKEKEKEERINKWSENTTYEPPKNQEVLDALSMIPHDYSYHERLPINFAIFDHFGEEGIDILLNHWLVENPKKLQTDLANQYKSHQKRGTGKYTIATLFADAIKHGYKPAAPRNTEKAEEKGKEPTYPVSKFYTVDEAQRELESIIDEFIETRQDTAVLFEAGAGKTWGTLQKLNEENLKRKRRLKVAYFVNSRTIASERKKEMIEGDGEHERIIDILKIVEKNGAGVSIMKGFGEDTCPDWEEGDTAGSKKCIECSYRYIFDEYCPYMRQYLGWNSRLDSFRLYQHAHLFQPSRLDGNLNVKDHKEWKPDLIVVDEDVVSNMIEMKYVKKGTSFPVIDLIIDDLVDSECRGIAEIVRPHVNQLKLDRRKLFRDKNIEDWDDQEKATLEVIRVLLSYANSEAIPSASLWIEGGHYLYVGWIKKIAEKWAGIPMLYLDASGNEKIISRVLNREFKFHRIRCQYQPNVEVIQVQNNVASKGWCNDNKDKIRAFIQLMEKKPNADKTGFISYKNVKSKSFISDLVADQSRCGWFGNVRGSNDFKTFSQLFIIGRHYIPKDEIIRIAKVVYRNWDENWADFMGDEFEARPFNDTIMRVEKTVRMKDGNHKTLKGNQYLDDRLHHLSEHLNQSETYQAIHRLRLVHGNDRKQVIYISKEVNDITVDRLVDDSAIFITLLRKEFVELVFANDGKIKLKSNKQIASLMRRSVRKIAKMKENNKEWMKQNIFFHVDEDGYCVVN